MAKNTPIIRAGLLIVEPSASGENQVIPLESDAWFAWLESAHSFTFEDSSGHFTARKKRRSWAEYWYAFRRGSSQTNETYLGKARNITLSRLRAVAVKLNQLAARAPGMRAEPLASAQPRQARGSRSSSPYFSTFAVAATAAAPGVPQVNLSQLVHTSAINQLAQAVEYPLTAVSAPAGYGKTTLLVQFIVASRLPAAWLTLGERDNDPVRFWTRVSAALEQVIPGLRAARPPRAGRGRRAADVSPAALLAALPNVSAPTLLILDDYHELRADNSAIHEAVAYLVEHLPPQMHLLVASRTVLPLPLAKLRARQRLLELGTADLRLTPPETRVFLSRRTRLELRDEEIAMLHARTEGWVAALQLAVLSLEEQADPHGWIAEFSGENRHIFDYLVEEVVKRMPPHLYEFVLQIAQLDRLSGPLCDAVTRSTNSQAMLEEMERANLFLVPLDDRREWYRLHHLVADVLRRHLLQTRPRLVPQLYARASVWCEAHNLALDAIDYALAAGGTALERAAQLVEAYIPIALASGYVMLLHERLERLPDRLMRERPRLCVAHAYTLYLKGEHTLSLRRLHEAEEALGRTAHVLDPAELVILRAEILALRSGIRLLLGEGSPRELIAALRQAAAVLPRDHELQSLITLYLGINQVLDGDTRAARQTLEHLMRASEVHGNGFYAAYIILILGLAMMSQGRFDDALTCCDRATRQRAGYGDNDLEARVHLIRGKIAYERNDLEQALEHLQHGILRRYDPSTFLLAGFPALAYAHLALGNAAAAHQAIEQHLTEWARLQTEHHMLWRWTGRQIRAHQARLWLLEGDIEAASAWARERERANYVASADGDEPPPYLREWEEIVLARLYLAQHRAADALALLTALDTAAEAGGRVARLLEILVLKALAHDALGDTAATLRALRQAVELGKSERFVRVFIEGGPSMQRLLSHLLARLHTDLARSGRHGRQRRTASLRPYIASLLDALALAKRGASQGHAEHMAAPRTGERAADVGLPAPKLTPRQRVVIRLIANGASNDDVADALVIQLSTAKRHASNIFARLDVHSRTQAVARARALGFLATDRYDEPPTHTDL